MRLTALALLMSGMSMAHAATHYVATTGSNSNPGTQVQPWKTIQYACDKVAEGDFVYVETGVYKEAVVIRRPMLLANAPGAKPVIDGTGIPVPAEDAALVLIKNLRNVTLNGFEIRNYKTANSTLLPIGVFVEGIGDAIHVTNNLVHNIENDGTDGAHINGFGIAVYGNSNLGAITNLIITYNEVRNTKTGSSETVTLNGNVNGFLVSHNLVHDVNNIGIDCIGFEGTSPIAGQDQARNGVVGENVVYNVSSVGNPAYTDGSADGIYIDGGANIVVERNIVHNADIGVEVASEHSSHFASFVTVRNNLVYHSNVVGLSIGGADASKGGARDCKFVNNTLAENDTTLSGTGEFSIQYYTLRNIFDNNLVVASSQGVLISSATGTAPGATSDYNLFYAPSNQDWTWNGNDYTTFAAFRAGTGNDKHSLFEQPSFVNAAALNFHLMNSSPAIAVGANLGASVVGAVDLDGKIRVRGTKIDMGCYEVQAPGP